MSHATARRPPRRMLRLAILLALILAASVFSLCIGTHWIHPLELWDLWRQGEDNSTGLSLSLVRIPRLLAGLGAGACLALSGALLQRLTRNPLVDPGLLGLNGGAALAVVAVLFTYSRRDAAPPWMLPFAAVAGAVAAAALVAMLVWGRRARNPATVLLVGVAVGAGAAALTQAVVILLDPKLLRWITAWQTGTLAGIASLPALALLCAAACGLPLALPLAADLDVVGLGDDLSMALGVNLERLRRKTLLLAACLGAVAVAWCGGLAFVGFLAPHLSRVLVGGGTRTELAGAGLCGALLLVLTDTLGRTMLTGNELPAGALLGVLGAPVFLVVLARWGGRR